MTPRATVALAPPMQTALQVGVAILLVAAVLWWMWHMPRDAESPPGWAAWLALVSPWAGLLAAGMSVLVWLTRWADLLLAITLLALDPLAVGCGVLVLWTMRDPQGRGAPSKGAAGPVGEDADAADLQRIQAWTGIALGLVAVAVGYTYALSHKTPFTPVGQ